MTQSSTGPSIGSAPLVVRTVPGDDPGALLDLLPDAHGTAWVRRGEGLVGWGEAAVLRPSGPERFAEARAWWEELARTAVVRDEVGEPGAGLVCFGSFAFADDPGDSVLVYVVRSDVPNNTIILSKRRAGGSTVIGAGCRIDNLVQIGHNVHLGRHCVIVAQTGISGSTTLEDFVVTGGQTGLTGGSSTSKWKRVPHPRVDS